MWSHRTYYSKYPSAMDLASYPETEGSHKLPSPRFYSSIRVPLIPALRLRGGSPCSRGLEGPRRRGKTVLDCHQGSRRSKGHHGPRALYRRYFTPAPSKWLPAPVQGAELSSFSCSQPTAGEIETDQETRSSTDAPGHPS